MARPRRPVQLEAFAPDELRLGDTPETWRRLEEEARRGSDALARRIKLVKPKSRQLPLFASEGGES